MHWIGWQAEYVCDFLLKDKSKLFYSKQKIGSNCRFVAGDIWRAANWASVHKHPECRGDG